MSDPTNQPSIEPITKEERRHVMMLARESRHGDWFTSPTDVVARYESALSASEAREKRLQERIDLAGKLLSDTFAEKESLLKNDYLFAAFSHVFPAPPLNRKEPG